MGLGVQREPTNTFDTYQVTVGTTGTPLLKNCVSNSGPVSIGNQTAASVFIGRTSAVTTATGFEIPAGLVYSTDYYQQIWAVSAAGGATVSVDANGNTQTEVNQPNTVPI